MHLNYEKTHTAMQSRKCFPGMLVTIKRSNDAKEYKKSTRTGYENLKIYTQT